MPVALATSKRKFHRLLENLTTSPPDGPSNITERPETGSPTVKRVRLDPLSRVSAAQTTAPTNTSAHRTLRQVTQAAKTTKQKPPNYAPWSHELFLDRLKTFANVRLWTSKPDPINDVQWAKRGWTCDGINRVACKGGCEQRVVIALRPRMKDEEGKEIEDSEDYSIEVEDELVGRYVELISTGHSESCLWRASGCKDDIYRLPIAKPTIWQPQLRDRYNSFTSSPDGLPTIARVSHPLDLKLTTSYLPTSFFSSHISPDPSGESADAATNADLNDTALALALLGWSGSLSSPGYALASCNVCFRRLGLWLYKADTTSSATELSSEEDEMKLDLITNHRDYCPWINADSQCTPGSFEGLAGWQILQRVIKNSVEFKRTSYEESRDGGGAVVEATENSPQSAQEMRPRSRDDVEKEDKARFARLRELTRTMGLKRLRAKLGKTKPGDAG